MNNTEKAKQVIEHWVYGNLPTINANRDIPEGITKALGKAGLLAPDLTEETITLPKLSFLATVTKAGKWETDSDSWSILDSQTGSVVVPIEFDNVDADDTQFITYVRLLVSLAPTMMHELIAIKRAQKKAGSN